MTEEASPVTLPRSYAHVLKLVTERPWALQPVVLQYIAELVEFRSEGGRLSADEIAERLAAARAENGDRNGGGVYGSVAIIPFYGLISQRTSLMSDFSGGASVDGLRESLRQALADPNVSAVVFDVDSPGGSVDGLTEFAEELRKASAGTKPIVAQVNTMAASAAYWLASQMSEVVVTPSGEVGSIGVYGAHQDMSGAMEQKGVRTTLISAGPYKTEGNPYEPLTDDARSAMQEQVDEFYSMFVGDVAKGRNVPVVTVADGYGGGRTLLAKGALAAGMVDRIDTLEATVSRLQRAAAPARRKSEDEPVPFRAETPVAARAAVKPDRAWNARVAKLTRRPR